MSEVATPIAPAYEVICDSADRAQWLEHRRAGIGGSDAPSILGLTTWASPMSVQVDKWGLVEEEESAEHMRWGLRLEGAILGGLADELGEKVDRFGKLIRSTTHPYMQCTPDGITESGVFVQAKNSTQARAWEDGPPPHVFAQVQHEMCVTGAEQCIVVALLMGNRLVWQRVARDEAFIRDTLLPAEVEFWSLTEEHEPVAPDASEHTKKALQLLYPQDTGEVIALDGHFTDLDDQRAGLLAQKKECEEGLRAIDNEFRAKMKDATFGELPNGVQFSLKSQTRKEHVVKASTFRVLRRKGAKR